MKQKVAAWWASLTPDRRRLTITAGCLIVLLGVLYLFMKAGPESSDKPRADAHADVNLLTGSDARTLGLEAVGAELREAQRKQRELQGALQQLQQQASTKDDLKSLTQQIASLAQSLNNVKDDGAGSASSPIVPLERTGNSRAGNGVGVRVTPNAPVSGVSSLPAEGGAGLRPASVPPEAAEPIKVRVYGEEEPQAANKAAITATGAVDDVFLPAGSIISGVLLTGVDAPTGQQAKRDPIPALMRIKHEAILPGRYRADVRECFMLFGVTGELSTVRGLMRGETLSCVRTDGGVIEVAIDAYAMGSDGKAGVRGRLIQRNGSLVAKAAFASFAEALSQIFRPVAITGLNTSGGSRTDFQAPDAAQALEAAGYAGFGGAAHRLSEYFVGLADEMIPFVEIDTARPIEAVLLKGVRLRIRSATS